MVRPLAVLAVLITSASPLRADEPRAGGEGQLVIVTTPPGTIVIDGEEIGRGTVSRRLLQGDHAVEVRWPGGGNTMELVRVTAGESRVIRQPVSTRGNRLRR